MTRSAQRPIMLFGIPPLWARLALVVAALCVGTQAPAAGIDPADSARRIAKYRLSDTRCAQATDQLAVAASAADGPSQSESPPQIQPPPAEAEEPALSERRPLIWNPALTAAAEQYARAMADQGFFAHTAPDGTTLAQRVDRTTYRWRSIAANLAAGYATLDETLDAWARSPGHCRNLLDGRYSEFGVARVRSRRAADRYGVYWVLVLGQPVAAPSRASASR